MLKVSENLQNFFQKMSKILISGSSGFIGKNLLELLEKTNLEIHTINSSKEIKNKKLLSHKLPNSILDIDELILDIKPDIFIHLAWKGIPIYSLENSIYSINNTINLTKACIKAGTKNIIATGSCWEYFNPNGIINEDWQLDDTNFFKKSKNFCRNILKIMCKEYSVNLIWLRLFYVYGQYQHKNSLLPYLINEAKSGREPIAKNPYCALDFVNVKDICEVIFKLTQLNFFKW